MRQIDYILSEVNYDTSKIKLVKCVAAHNEAGWIRENLANNYDEYDVIRVVEGAVVGRPNSTPDGHSTDETVDLIKNFPDPANKIELYQMRRPFKSLEEGKQIFLDLARDGEWLFIVDADEFYLDGDVSRIRKAIHQHPMASEFIPTFLHFYRDSQHIRDIAPEWTLNHQRIVRARQGARFHTHPVMTLADGTCTYFDPRMQMLRYMTPILIFHYGHAKGPEFHTMKRDFYRSELSKFPAGHGKSAADAFDEKFKEYVEFSENLQEIYYYDGPHPSCLENHPCLQKTDPFYLDKQFKNWRQSPYFSKWPNVPTIPQWMLDWPWAKAKMQPFYNQIDV